MDDESKRLIARLEELLSRAEDGVFAATEFLTPAEAYHLHAYAARSGRGDRILLYGGAEGAERTVLCALPDYYLPYTEMDGDERRAYCQEAAAEELNATVSAILVEGSTYRTLTHRDYLGSVLALGTVPENRTIFRIKAYQICKESAIYILRCLIKENLVIHMIAHILHQRIICILKEHHDHFLLTLLLF